MLLKNTARKHGKKFWQKILAKKSGKSAVGVGSTKPAEKNIGEKYVYEVARMPVVW